MVRSYVPKVNPNGSIFFYPFYVEVDFFADLVVLIAGVPSGGVSCAIAAMLGNKSTSAISAPIILRN